MNIIAGAVFNIPYPFVKETYHGYDEEGGFSKPTWRPGVKREGGGSDGASIYTSADGRGEQILTVISTHKPGKFPERVFYTVRWKSPDGKEFGKSRVKVCGVQKFRRLASGYRYEDEIDKWN